MKWDGFNWLVVNPRADYLDIAIADTCDYHRPKLINVDIATAIVGVTTQPRQCRLRSRWFVGPITCVEYIKALLGIRAFWIWTPWQLYRYVRAHRGIVQKAKGARPVR